MKIEVVEWSASTKIKYPLFYLNSLAVDGARGGSAIPHGVGRSRGGVLCEPKGGIVQSALARLQSGVAVSSNETQGTEAVHLCCVNSRNAQS